MRDGEELSRLSALCDDEARRRRDAEQAVAAAEAHAEQCERRAALTLARLDEDERAPEDARIAIGRLVERNQSHPTNNRSPATSMTKLSISRASSATCAAATSSSF